MTHCEKLGPYKPALILHGGAGSLSRTNLPPQLYQRYHTSLLKYLTDTRQLLESGASALDAACHAVALFEDDVLFNCGRGSVFTEKGTIEMEASVMVTSVDPAGPPAGRIKRGAAVSLVRNTRHPILLAKEVLTTPDEDGGLSGTSTMHCHLSGRDVEEWGWQERGLEKKPDQWFWTRRRWEEHRGGLHLSGSYTFDDLIASVDPFLELPSENLNDFADEILFPSQGTVGAVCLDSHGNLAVATSTGGLTNKKAGRIGDTPTIGSGFWAEAWIEDVHNNGITPTHRQLPLQLVSSRRMPALDELWAQASSLVGSCFDTADTEGHLQDKEAPPRPPAYADTPPMAYRACQSSQSVPFPSSFDRPMRQRRRAVAMSGTGNGDSFLRTAACRTAASICTLRSPGSPALADAIRLIAGPYGELQRSAGDRWGKTGEGQGGIIGIEVIDELESHPQPRSINGCAGLEAKKKRGKVVFDFNCGGLFRAYYEVDEKSGQEKPKVMVFRDDYSDTS